MWRSSLLSTPLVTPSPLLWVRTYTIPSPLPSDNVAGAASEAVIHRMHTPYGYYELSSFITL